MKLFFFIFQPDTHYGYPEFIFQDTFLQPKSLEFIYERYVNAGYSACSEWAFEEGEEEMTQQAVLRAFLDSGKYDLYDYTFSVVCETEREIEESFWNLVGMEYQEVKLFDRFWSGLHKKYPESFYFPRNKISKSGDPIKEILSSFSDQYLEKFFIEWPASNSDPVFLQIIEELKDRRKDIPKLELLRRQHQRMKYK